MVAAAALAALVPLAFADAARATRSVEVTFANHTGQPAIVQWWGDECLNSCEFPRAVQLPAKGSVSVTSSTDAGSRWDIIGRVGLMWNRTLINFNTQIDGQLWGPCFAGRNPALGQPRFAMAERIKKQDSHRNEWKVCDTGHGVGAFDQTFEQDVQRVFFQGGPSPDYPGANYGTMLVSRSQDSAASIRFFVSVIALPTPPQRTASVEVNDPNGGTVVSVPAGIDCGTTCSGSFTRGVGVQMLAKPKPGYYLAAWGGDCLGRDDDCVLYTAKDTKAVATFLPIPPDRLNVAFAGDGGGRVTGDLNGMDCVTPSSACTVDLPHGSSVLLRAYPDSESEFRGWGGACAGTADTCLVSMTQAQSVEARFALRPTVTLRVDLGGVGQVTGGGITCRSPEAPSAPNVCARTFTRGATVILTAASIGDAVFQGWGGTGGCGIANPCTITLDRSYRPSAQFAKPVTPLRLQVLKSGSGTGRVTGPRIDCGTTCTSEFIGTPLLGLTFSATPDAGSRFDHWEGACRGSGTQGTCRTMLIGEVTAVFTALPAPAQSTLTVSTAGDGTGVVQSTPTGIVCGASCAGAFATGTRVVLEADPAPGSEFSGWSGACVGDRPTCAVRVDASRRAVAVFSRTPSIDPATPSVDPIPPAPIVQAVESVSSAQPYEVLLAPAVPALTDLRVSRRVLRRGGSAIVRYSLDRSADVRMTFRRVGERRIRYVYRIRHGASGADAGENAVRILTRIRNRNVPLGRWTMTIEATSPTGSSPLLHRRLVLRN